MEPNLLSFAFLQLSNLPIHQPPIPQTLPEVPAEAGKAVEEAELEEVADAEVDKGSQTWQESVVVSFTLKRPAMDHAECDFRRVRH